MAEAVPVRPAARVLVLDPDGRVLLFGARLVDLATPPGPVLYWYTPGGQIEPGESVRQGGAPPRARGGGAGPVPCAPRRGGGGRRGGEGWVRGVGGSCQK